MTARPSTGNGVRDGAEACDGSDLGGNDCASLGGGGATSAAITRAGSISRTARTSAATASVRARRRAELRRNDFGGLTCADFGGTAAEGHLVCVGCHRFHLLQSEPADCDSNPTSDIVPPRHRAGEGRDVRDQRASGEGDHHQIDVCGSAIPDGPDSCGTEPATSGTANVFVPDLTRSSVRSTSPRRNPGRGSGRGRAPKAGHTVGIIIPLMNGPRTATNVHAVLSSPAYDIDGDGVPDAVTISQPASDYPGLPARGTRGRTGDCDTLAAPPIACANLTPFVVTFPDGHRRRVAQVHPGHPQRADTRLGHPPALHALRVGIAAPPITCGNSILEPGEDATIATPHGTAARPRAFEGAAPRAGTTETRAPPTPATAPATAPTRTSARAATTGIPARSSTPAATASAWARGRRPATTATPARTTPALRGRLLLREQQHVRGESQGPGLLEAHLRRAPPLGRVHQPRGRRVRERHVHLR